MLESVPSIAREGNVEEKIKKMHSYLISLKDSLEYELQNVQADGGAANNDQLLKDLENLFGDLNFDPLDVIYWNRIKEITNELGNVITSKLEGNIRTSINKILNGTSTLEFNDKGIMLHDKETEEESSWCMMLGAEGFMIANGKIVNDVNNSWKWDWQVFGTGEGFTANCITAGELNAITLRACNLIATNITSGTIQGVTISSAHMISMLVEATNITGGTITGAEIIGSTITGTTMITSVLEAAVINASEFNTSTFNTGKITSSEIEANMITGNTIVGGSITGTDITGNTLTGNTIEGGLITGAIVQSIGENGDGVTLYDKGIHVYGEGGTGAATFFYDINGAGTPEEATNRVFLGTKSGYSLKIYSDGNMSISAAPGKKIYIGDVGFMGTVGFKNSDAYNNLNLKMYNTTPTQEQLTADGIKVGDIILIREG